MNREPIKVLLVEDDEHDAFLLKRALNGASSDSFTLSIAPAIGVALELLRSNGYDVVVVDLSLPDGQGVEIVRRIIGVAPQVAMVAMTGILEDAAATALFREGVQDYLIKGELEGRLVARALRYA